MNQWPFETPATKATMAQIMLLANILNPPKDEGTKFAPHGPLDRETAKANREHFKRIRGDG